MTVGSKRVRARVGVRSLHVRRALRGLCSAVENERAFAVRALGVLGSDRQQRMVVAALRDEVPHVRHSAAVAMGLRRWVQGARALVRALRGDSAAEVREGAAEALGKIGASWSRPALLAAAECDPEGGVRVAALHALAEMPPSRREGRVGRRLSRVLLKDPSPDVRAAAAGVLAAYAGRAAVGVLGRAFTRERDWLVRSMIVEALGNLQDLGALPALRRAVSDSERMVRLDAVEALARLSHAKAVVALVRALEHPDEEIRDSAAEHLATSHEWASSGDEALRILLLRLSAPHPKVRVNAAHRLKEKLDPRAVRPLCECLHDESRGVRAASATALGAIGDDSVVGELARLLRDRDTHVRASAVRALAALRSASAFQPLLGALRDRSGRVRHAAARGVGEIGGVLAGDALFRLRADRDVAVRVEAALALGRLGDPRAEGLLRSLAALPEVSERDEWGHSLAELVQEGLGKLGKPRGGLGRKASTGARLSQDR